MQMQHPDGKRTITVADDMAAMYQSQGWCEVEAESVEKPAPKKRAARPRKPKH